MDFVPDNFLVLNADVKVSPLPATGWRDPLGNVARANAQKFALGQSVTAGAPEQPGTTWSRVLGPGGVTVLQPPLTGDDDARLRFAAVLMQQGITDLFAVSPGAWQGQKGALALNKKDLAVAALADPFDLAVALSGSGRTGRLDMRFADFKDEDTALFPKGRVAISLQARASGVARTQHINTHWVDLADVGWVTKLVKTLRYGWHDRGKAPLWPAVMCHDGAGKSGVLAAAMHAMECLEQFNRKALVLNSPRELADQMRQFIQRGQEVRSSRFGEHLHRAAYGRSLDGLAKEIWQEWSKVQSQPESPVVQAASERARLASPARAPLPMGSSEVGDAQSGHDDDATWSLSGGGSLPPVIEEDEVDGPEGETEGKTPFSLPLDASPGGATEGARLAAPALSKSGTWPNPVRRPLLHRAESTRSEETRGAIDEAIDHFDRISFNSSVLRGPAGKRGLYSRQTSSISNTSNASSGGRLGPKPGTASAFIEAWLLWRTDRSQDAADQLPDIQKRWSAGGENFEALLPQVSALAKEMTRPTGVRGYLRARTESGHGEKLSPLLGWATEVAETIQQQLDNSDHRGKSAAPALIGGVIKDLLQHVFNGLDGAARSRWRDRIQGSSSRYGEAVADSEHEVLELPKRLQLGGSLTDLSVDPAQPGTSSTVMPHSRVNLRAEVDKVWARHTLLQLMREVARPPRPSPAETSP